MGVYINPTNESKEEFLAKQTMLPGAPTKEEFDAYMEQGRMPVCLMHNGYFTAAGICYSWNEVQVFSAPVDLRPTPIRRMWFVVNIEDLHPVSPELKEVLDFDV